MTQKNNQKRTITILFVSVTLFGSLFFFGCESNQESSKETLISEELLEQKIKEGISKQLEESEFLTKKIEEGIQKFIVKLKQSQRQSQANRESEASKKAKNVRQVSTTKDHIYGNPDAEVSLIEYSDFECPFCKRFHSTPKKLVEEYGGKVNWVYRHFPLGFHNPGAQKQAEASECASELGGNKAFWKYADLLYERTTSNGKGFPLNNLVPLAKEIGLNEKQFKTCLESGKYTKLVQTDISEGVEAGITGTPGNIIIHNKTGETILKSGALPIEAFKVVIEQMLKNKSDG